MSITLTLLKNNPNSTKVIRDWCFQELVDSVKKDKSIPEEFSKSILEKSFGYEEICKLIDAQPRNFFDAFDAQKIYIHISIHEESQIRFAFKINDSFSKVYDSRKECELNAIYAAFEILEDKLKNKKDENN